MPAETIDTHTPNAPNGPTNEPPELSVAEIGRIHAGEVTKYQKPRKVRAGTRIDKSRWRELRRHLLHKQL